MKNSFFLVFLVLLLCAWSPIKSQELLVLEPGEEKYSYTGIPTDNELSGMSDEEIYAIYSDIMCRQSMAVNAMEKTMKLFDVDKDGKWIYPEEYA